MFIQIGPHAYVNINNICDIFKHTDDWKLTMVSKAEDGGSEILIIDPEYVDRFFQLLPTKTTTHG